MKKHLMILTAFLFFGFYASAQNCGVSTEWRKDGGCGTGNGWTGYTCYVSCYNSNNYDVTVYVEVKAVNVDGTEKTLSETFTIKANSNKTTTVGKYAILDTGWGGQVDTYKSTITVTCQ